MDIFGKFIQDHERDDTARLLLGRSKWPDIDMDLAVRTLEGRRRMRTKAPSWYALPSLRYPTRLSTEQCSSEATARYKAALARRILASSPSESPAGHPERPTPPQDFPAGHPERSEGSVADLTGGLGLDTWAFAAVAKTVLHNEMDPVLSDAVRHNLSRLGVHNATFRGAELSPGTLNDILDGFQPDLIFLDPARRAADGSKVFRLEDCQPDILQLLPELTACCRHLLLKISPMADISLVVNQLDKTKISPMADISLAVNQLIEANPEQTESHPNHIPAKENQDDSRMKVREVHIVGSEGECKELLLWLDREWTDPYTLYISEIRDTTGTAATLAFPADSEARAAGTSTTFPNDSEARATRGTARTAIAPSTDWQEDGPMGSAGDDGDTSRLEWPVGALLFEPGKALAKAGLFTTLAHRYGLQKLSRHTHLYILPTPIADRDSRPETDPIDVRPTRQTIDKPTIPETSNAAELLPFGKTYRILDWQPLSSKTLKSLRAKWPHAEVTAKDIPLTSDELRKRLKVTPGGNIHIFGCRINGTPILLITRQAGT